jgi:hypothetical protein
MPVAPALKVGSQANAGELRGVLRLLLNRRAAAEMRIVLLVAYLRRNQMHGNPMPLPGRPGVRSTPGMTVFRGLAPGSSSRMLRAGKEPAGGRRWPGTPAC